MSRALAIVGPLGPLELGIILLILIVIFGPKRLPGMGRSLGEGMREFKDSITGGGSDSADKPEGLRAADREDEPAVAAEPAQQAVPARERE